MTLATRPEIFEQMSALADSLRSRILLILESQELTVGELCSVLQVPQSTASRHLKTLGEAGWVASRPDGTRRLYRLGDQANDDAVGRLWRLTRESLASVPEAEEDARRLRGVLASRRHRSREFFDESAEHWDRLRAELFGEQFALLGLLDLLDPAWIVADLGCGTGALSETLAPSVARVYAIDGSSSMLSSARRRLERFDHVDVRAGELEALPLDDGSVDVAVLFLVLHHLPEPATALREVARILRPGGRVLAVDMLPHQRDEYQREMGHVWLGFDQERIETICRGEGLEPTRFRALPADPDAKGPSLFSATAVRPAVASID